MKVYKLILCLFVAALSLYSCDPIFNCLDGNGILVSEKRPLNEFTGVENNSSFDVNIVFDSVFSVEVIADKNLLDEIATSVNNGQLIIDKTKNRCIDPSNDIIINVRMPIVVKIELNGSGGIDVGNFNTEYLEVENSGSGNIELGRINTQDILFVKLSGSGRIEINGESEFANYSLSGSGAIYADNFWVDHCSVTNSGSGNVYCSARNAFYATLTGSGDIIYSGSPIDVRINDDGSGKVYKKN